jgi:CubicO group peptidase (beta-lactamase class C family)
MQRSAFIKKRRATTIALSLLVLLVVGFPNATPALNSAVGLTDPAELEAFMDGVVETQLAAYNTAGATVAVVKNGALFFAKGYGYADIKERKRVQADKTLFRIASISKLFVWTAVMQLVEQGKLDLNTDVNTYLTQFKIPDTYDEPITLSHLMTHTAGFEEHILHLFVKDADLLLPLGDILAKELPARVRPPDVIVSYSNHGTAIAAYIIEQVSGKPWNEYVEQNILKPLEMTQTTFRQPVPQELLEDISKGYTYSGGEFQEQAFVYVPLAPVASASSTATDMANFMIAHLESGRFGDSHIFHAKTAHQMHRALFRHAQEVNPIAHGFFDISRNGQWVIGHNGNILYFHSQIALLPEQNVGLFVSYNSQGGAKAARKTYELFMNRYYPPGNIQMPTPIENAPDRLQRFTGSYFSSRRVHSRFTKLGALLQTVKISLTDDGALKTTGSETTRWIETKPLIFRKENGLGTLVFREDDQGRITHMFIGDIPYIALERVGFTDSITLHGILAITAILLFLTTTFSWPFAAIIRWRHHVKVNRRTHIPRLAYIAAWGASLLFIVVAAFIAVGVSDPYAVIFDIPVWIKASLVLAMLSALMTIGVLIYTVLIWKAGKGSLWGRVYYTAVMLALVSTIWQLNHWKLLGFHY